MNGNNVVLDTNIILYLLQGDAVLQDFLKEKDFTLSFINELELLGFRKITPNEEHSLRYFLDECAILDINQGIKDITVQLRRKYSLKLPDAIICATAIFLGIPLLSADRHFGQIEELLFVLYQP
ncbi:type II toxin-antitoxin system VapC family toxin [Persicitalea sp.]|uniref:type II toxin-antitoxin system VapC family toxin n=1 Tax=Persicitalea sp. TaxID=3100273 RepID=UPI0035935947